MPRKAHGGGGGGLARTPKTDTGVGPPWKLPKLFTGWGHFENRKLFLAKLHEVPMGCPPRLWTRDDCNNGAVGSTSSLSPVTFQG